MATTVASYLVVPSCQGSAGSDVAHAFSHHRGRLASFRKNLHGGGRLPIWVLVAVVRFVIVAVPELTEIGAAAELTCYGSAETARPLALHKWSWILLH